MSKYLTLDPDSFDTHSREDDVIRIVKAENKRKALEKFFANEWNKGEGIWSYKSNRDHCDWSEHIIPYGTEEEMMSVMLKSLKDNFGDKIGQELYDYYNFLWEFNEDKNEEYMVYPTFEQDYKLSDEAIACFFKKEIDEIIEDDDRPIYTDIKIMEYNSVEVIE